MVYDKFPEKLSYTIFLYYLKKYRMAAPIANPIRMNSQNLLLSFL
jgi:hypothetical protein